MQDEEWTDWIEHDGQGCPCVGQMVERVLSTCGEGVLHTTRREESSIVGIVPAAAAGVRSPWYWHNFMKINSNGRRVAKVIRYRIRKPRALLDLIERARSLDDAPEGPRHVKHKETAK